MNSAQLNPMNILYIRYKHIRPDIKHNRIPALNLNFDSPNLSFIITEIIIHLL